jgi:hypothetical protein
VSGLREDAFVRYECRLRATSANVLALRATPFGWTDAAVRLAMPVAPPEDAVEAVRRTMAELARQNVETDRRYYDLARRLSAVDPGSIEAEALAAELQNLPGGIP